MIDDIFACPIRKYNINNKDIKTWANNIYDTEKFNTATIPFRHQFTDSEFPSQGYVDTLEQFVKDLGLHKTHVALIRNAVLCVLEKGETLSVCNTLPSHYTFTHYIEGVSPDVFYHPARTLLEVFNPGLDEWSAAVSVYTNEGDAIVHPSYLDYTTPPVDKRRVSLTLLLELHQR